MKDNSKKHRSPWFWVPSLYFAEGIPYAIVATSFAVTMYTQLGLSNAEVAFYTSWLYLPWVIKPFWSPFVDAFKTKRWWILLTQLLVGAGLAGVAFCIPMDSFLQSTLFLLWLVAFSSATHDIAADGFYILSLREKEQSFFVGIRSTFYRISMIVGQGLLVYIAGFLEWKTKDVPYAWSLTFMVAAGVFLLFAGYHFFSLPRPESDVAVADRKVMTAFEDSVSNFFKKKNIVISLLFVLLYRLGEAQLTKIASPFLLDEVAEGGLGLSTKEVGVVYGTIGVLALTIGGILGGIAVSKHGLRKWLWPMVLSMNLPNLVYVYMAYSQPTNFYEISSLVAVEQFGYGFGFTAFMLYLIYMSKGEFATSHYALCTGLMALGMMLPGMIAGWIQEQIGYELFFVWVCLCTLPGFLLVKFLEFDDDFGRK
jgi:PAT family beta-lactamase induction signal transducer AmpG